MVDNEMAGFEVKMSWTHTLEYSAVIKSNKLDLHKTTCIQCKNIVERLKVINRIIQNLYKSITFIDS